MSTKDGKDSKDEKEEPAEEIDPALDFSSEHFDPLKALYADNVKLPVPNAKPFDNLCQYEAYQKYGEKMRQAKAAKPSKAAPLVSTPSTSAAPVRRFLPHQEPTTSKKPFVQKNILTRMEKCTVGVYGALGKCLEADRKIIVHTRRAHEVRGTLEGRLEAFDKHWNMALTDVTEQWTRRKFKQVQDTKSSAVPSTSKIIHPIRVDIPKVTIVSSKAKYETCSRFIKQLIVRGEHVVLVITGS